MAWLILNPPGPPQKFQYPAPTIGLRVDGVISAQMFALPVNVMSRPIALTNGAITDVNSCEKNKRKGRDMAPMSINRFTNFETSHPLRTIRKTPRSVQTRPDLLCEM